MPNNLMPQTADDFMELTRIAGEVEGVAMGDEFGEALDFEQMMEDEPLTPERMLEVLTLYHDPRAISQAIDTYPERVLDSSMPTHIRSEIQAFERSCDSWVRSDPDRTDSLVRFIVPMGIGAVFGGVGAIVGTGVGLLAAFLPERWPNSPESKFERRKAQALELYNKKIKRLEARLERYPVDLGDIVLVDDNMGLKVGVASAKEKKGKSFIKLHHNASKTYIKGYEPENIACALEPMGGPLSMEDLVKLKKGTPLCITGQPEQLKCDYVGFLQDVHEKSIILSCGNDEFSGNAWFVLDGLEQQNRSIYLLKTKFR